VTTHKVPAVVGVYAARRLVGGEVELLTMGERGQDRWVPLARFTVEEWCHLIAAVSMYADEDTNFFLDAMRAANHLHMGRHQR
jgi:hypothetical protein